MSINQEVYQGLKKILVASGQLDAVIDMFLSNSNNRLLALNDAIKAHDAEAIFRIAHAIKGSCSMLGGTKCAELCKAIEEGANQSFATDVQRLSDLLTNELSEMSRFLLNERGNGSTGCCE